MRLPELTSRIRQALLDRHAQVNQVESLVASRKVAASRDRKLDGRAAADGAQVNPVARRQGKQSDADQQQGDQDDPPSRGQRGRFVDVEV